MNPLAWDTETCLIRPALCAPPLVCATWQRPGQEPGIEHVSNVEPRIRAWLEDSSTLLIGHFVAYDAAVVCAKFPHLIPRVFAAYRAGRVTCTKKRQQLLDIAGGVYRGRPGEKGKWIKHDYTLDALSRRLLGKPLQKDGWRLYYDRFLDVPIAKWPARAVEVQTWARARLEALPNLAAMSAKERDALPPEVVDEVRNLNALAADAPEGCIRYPLDDARTTLDVWTQQEAHAEWLQDQYRQAYADFVLYLSSAWGLRTHGPGVAALRAQTEAALAELQTYLVEAGLVRTDGSRDTKATKARMVAVCRERGIPVRRTDAHAKCELGDACDEHVSLDSDACDAVADEDEVLGQYAEFSTLRKVLSNDLEMLAGGVVYPVHTRYDIAETGRTTSSKPNIQNLRRLPGIRECFVPRPGKVFMQADYPQLELYTLAQCCVSWLGHSKLGEALNSGLDPHLAMAATILGFTYDEAKANKKRADVDNARQTAKVANFGFPGGLGVAKLCLFARKTYGVDLSLDDAKTLKQQWFTTWPEMVAYFARVNSFFGDGIERASIETLFTKRHRGGATYCAACNNGFQALGVDCMKRALCLIAEAQYCDQSSPLYGSRSNACVHDEAIGECDDGPKAHDAAFELARLMVEGARPYLPDVPIRMESMEPTLMRVLSKKAVQVWDANGRLVPWEPVERKAA